MEKEKEATIQGLGLDVRDVGLRRLSGLGSGGYALGFGVKGLRFTL